MDIIFYNTTSENNRVGKVLTNEKTLSGAFKSEVDVQNPIIEVSTDLMAYNYCYIPDLNRYYFINKVEITRNNFYTIFLHIDVLETYANEIKKLHVVISNSSGGNPYYNGYISGIDVRTDYETKQFENNFEENGEIVLVAVYGSERA